MDRVHRSGRCFCGIVEYKLTGEVNEAFFCHCDSCRRSSGAPFLAWARVRAEDFEFVRGELSTFKSSPRVIRSFCPKCGTELIYQHDDYQAEIDIPLGTFDAPEEIVPTYHVWIDEKLPWVDINDKLPKYRKRHPQDV